MNEIMWQAIKPEIYLLINWPQEYKTAFGFGLGLTFDTNKQFFRQQDNTK